MMSGTAVGEVFVRSGARRMATLIQTARFAKRHSGVKRELKDFNTIISLAQKIFLFRWVERSPDKKSV